MAGGTAELTNLNSQQPGSNLFTKKGMMRRKREKEGIKVTTRGRRPLVVANTCTVDLYAENIIDNGSPIDYALNRNFGSGLHNREEMEHFTPIDVFLPWMLCGSWH